MKTVFHIQNLKCGGCENTIKKSMNKFDFVRNLEVDVEAGTITMDTMPPEYLKFVTNTLSNMGYPIVEDSNSLGKKMKSYVSCAIGKMTN